VQYCGVLEFSSPEGVCHLPHWMMESLALREGGRVTLRSAPRLPKGEFARFQPHTEAFLDFASALGVRNVLELAMQHYSALAVGQTVLIQYGNDKYFLDVVEVKPGPAISLYGTVDLKVEFAPVPGSAAALQAAAEAEAEALAAVAAASGSPSPESDSPAPSPSPRTRSARTSPRSSSSSSRARDGAQKGPSTPAGKPASGRRPRVQNIRGKGADANAKSKPTPRQSFKQRPEASSVPSPNSAASINAMASKRASRLSKFKKRGALSLGGGGGGGGGTANGNAGATTGLAAASKSSHPVRAAESKAQDVAAASTTKTSLGRSLASGATVKFETPAPNADTAATAAGAPAHETKEGKPTWGAGYVLKSSSPRKFEEAPVAPATAAAKQEDAPKSDEKKVPFSGKGATLGGGGETSSSSSSVGAAAPPPWAAAAKARHERYRKKKEAEDAKVRAAEEAQRRETEEKCRAIAEAAAAAMSEEDKKKAARKAELDAKREAIESQIEDKLKRDAEMKERRKSRAEAKQRAALDKAAALEAQVEDLEAMALAHAVQQSVESASTSSSGRRNSRRRDTSDIDDALMNAAILESTARARGGRKSSSSSSSRGRSSMDMLSEASKEVRAGGPSAPERSRRQKSVSPPDQRKKTRPANNRYGSGGGSGGGDGGGGQGPLQLYAKQIDSLVEMGFTNTIASAQALEAASGDVQRAIEFLTGEFGRGFPSSCVGVWSVQNILS
jgi:ubiquitin fusion degradation protein 1